MSEADDTNKFDSFQLKKVKTKTKKHFFDNGSFEKVQLPKSGWRIVG